MFGVSYGVGFGWLVVFLFGLIFVFVVFFGVLGFFLGDCFW